MSKLRNTGITGGAVLLLLWGGIGFFFGKGKGKGQGSQAGKTKVETRSTPRQRVPVRKMASVTKKTTLKKKKLPKKTTQTQETFRYLIRMTFIHPILPDGRHSDKTISVDELVAKGKAAQRAKKELLLTISGDARAVWLEKLKRTLKEKQVSFSISHDF